MHSLNNISISMVHGTFLSKLWPIFSYNLQKGVHCPKSIWHMEQHYFPSCDWILITTWKMDYKNWLPIPTQPPPYSNLIPNYPLSTSNSQLKMFFIISTPTKDLWPLKTPNSCPRLLTSQGSQLLPKMKLIMTFNFPWPTKIFDYLQCFKIPNFCQPPNC